MPEQRGTRRRLLGLLAAGSAALGRGRGTRAADNGPYRRPDYNSRAEFRSMCELAGGTFFADLYRIACCIPDYGCIDCDNDGKDCWVTPESAPPPGPRLPGHGNEIDDSPAQNQQSRAKRGKGKKGKRRGHGRKGRAEPRGKSGRQRWSQTASTN